MKAKLFSTIVYEYETYYDKNGRKRKRRIKVTKPTTLTLKSNKQNSFERGFEAKILENLNIAFNDGYQKIYIEKKNKSVTLVR